MNISEVMQNLTRICAVTEVQGGFRITTSCLYPSNGLVRVFVRGAMVGKVVVSDDGEALGEGTAAGIHLDNPDRKLRHFAKSHGLVVKDGVLSSPKVDVNAAHVAVLHVANTARDLANWVYEHGALKRQRDFRFLLSNFLESTFRENLAEDKIFGASSKHHKFSNVISFANGKKLIIDAVANDPSSINSRVVANLDVKRVDNPNIVQRIVFDDKEKWAPSDLSLLQIGATLVPFSKATDVITRVANETRKTA